MTAPPEFEIFLVATPGLEPVLLDEVRAQGFAGAEPAEGGVTCRGGWPEVWRANLVLRGAGRVLVRLGSFRALHLAQLDKRARRFPWAAALRPDVPVRVEATCRGSRIYHAGAAAQRIARAIAEELGAPADAAGGSPASLRVMARIEDDLCTISLDTSGEGLYKRGFKEAVGKAPLRETMAALFLRACDYRGLEPVLDPMCGSGTLVIEAAEIARGLMPGRARRFAFEDLAGFDPAALAALKPGWDRPATPPPGVMFHGSDRDGGVVAMARANAARAGVADLAAFIQRPVGELVAPEGPPGLVIVNPPYGARIGDKRQLFALHAALGDRLRAGFAGWRVGIITAEPALARATGLRFAPPGAPPSAPVAHGGLKVHLFRTAPLD